MLNFLPKNHNKLVVIVGPNASGKSDLAVKLAKKFNGEIVSADSRQVYKGMDVGTGKITKEEMQRIPHYLLDVASPKTRFSVAQYQKKAISAIKKIQRKGKLPILCGGTGFYIQAVVDGIIFPKVKPDWKLRENLEKKSEDELYKMLKKLDPDRAKTIEKKNKRRLIRAIEIVLKTGKPVPELKRKQLFDVLIIGIKRDKQELKERIRKRLLKRLKQGMIEEVKKLKESGVSWKRLDEFGLEYRWIARYLQKKIPYKEMVEKLQKDIENYAKRQLTWFKRDKRIHWVRNYKEAEKIVKEFLNQ
ncbi:MAG: tRNA (adenosine(37)-N6)-dimethylallyltransferase MiaA [Candidatus Pacebacteria bacterium]|nr:tRNA (adenosine(37)-N6)-dimethylallyltransferase MiaA [Candidatus Paceibacterota bacterium]